MEGKNSEDQFAINRVESPLEVDLGNGQKSSIKSSEENPKKPFNSNIQGKNGKGASAGALLASGEKNQESDKLSEDSWMNNTGARMAKSLGTGGAAAMMLRGGGAGQFKKVFKTAGPIGTVLIILAVGMATALISMSTMLASLVNNLNLQYDPVNVATNIKSRVLFKMQMKGSIRNNSKWADFTMHQKRKLKRAGIEIETKWSGAHRYKVLKYTDDDHNVSYVAADAETANKLKGKFGDADITDFETKIQNDNDFHTHYQDGTATWRTSVGLMFDKVANKVFDALNVKRNTFTDVEQKAPADGDYDKAKAAVDEDFDGEFKKATTGDADLEATRNKKGETDDPTDPNKKISTVDEDLGQSKFDGDEGSIRQKIESSDGAVSKALDSDDAAGGGSAMGVISNVVEGTCQAYNITTGMNRMIKAYEKAQVVVMGLKVLEGIQRMQAGDGGGDVIADVIGNNLTEVVEQKVKLQSSSDGYEEKYEVLKGSVMSSMAIGAVYGGAQLTSNAPEVRALVVPESSIRKILSAIGNNSATGYKACAMGNLAANVTDVIINIASLGTATIAGMLIGALSGFVKGAIIAGLVAFFVPRIASMLSREFKDLIKGPIGGAALSWAVSHALGKNSQAAGFRPATKDTLIQYAQAKQGVINDEIRYARNNYSPFDTSSPYTFMGTLIRTMGSTLTKGSTLLSRANQLTNITSKSVTAFVPGAFAQQKSVDELVSLGECTDLNNMNSGSGNGPLGDAFCEQVQVPNMTKNAMAPDKVVEWLQDHNCTDAKDVVFGKKAFGDSFDRNKEEFDKNLNIEADSCLDRFGEEWALRQAPAGEPDDDIASTYEGNDGMLMGGAKSLFSLGIVDVLKSLNVATHLSNIIGDEYTDPSSPNAEYYNVAEQFFTWERMREALTGGEENSAVSRYVEKYYEEHPLDNSFEGILARYSGMSKEKVSLLLEVGEELTFLADYKPDGLYPLAYHDDHEVKIQNNNQDIESVIVAQVPYIILETPLNKRDTTL